MKKVYILISITSSQNQTLVNILEYFKSIKVSMSNIYLITNTNDEILDSLIKFIGQLSIILSFVFVTKYILDIEMPIDLKYSITLSKV